MPGARRHELGVLEVAVEMLVVRVVKIHLAVFHAATASLIWP
jgi:hypothetical protein